MKMSRMFMPTLREVPAEAAIASHQLLLRAAMIRKLSNGLYAYLPLGVKVFNKIAQIIREEHEAIGALECKPTVLVPGELWEESGRWYSMGDELLRVKNRLDQNLVVSPTAEEAFTDILRNELTSYKQYPLAVYQINTKYRDEVRPRYGLMRTREFTMKDAYSFHTTAESLDKGYQDFSNAYRAIFKRCGLTVIDVSADSGAMGGSGSEEFMVESVVGDNTLVLCASCGYAANVEKAECAPDSVSAEDGKKEIPAFTDVETPDAKTIEQVSAFLHTSSKSFIKTLIYAVAGSTVTESPFVAVCIRGDLDVNETKLKARLDAADIMLAANTDVERVTGAPLGFAGPVGLTGIPVIADMTVMAMEEGITGGLKKDLHYVHVVPQRDFTPAYTWDIRVVQDGDRCSKCAHPLHTKKGNELGHVFKLGTKYTQSMHMTYLDENGKQQHPLMGCYGIGLDRLLASVVEEHHDDNGIIWPMPLAPYQAAIVPITYGGELKDIADTVYSDLKRAGIDVLLDDRSERTGVKFKDMDLIGIPVRMVIGAKNLPNIEVKLRGQTQTHLVPQEQIVQYMSDVIREQERKFYP